ncbi:MAG TPA: hypothetical protein VFK52_11200 [Nocardioidaceae bacterium]|nr:hypothetical protein [Nocardioidaceae bacterium]
MRSLTWTALGCWLLASCSFLAGDDNGQVLKGGDIHVLVAPPASGGEDARVGGRLTLVGDCLGIDQDVALWPSGTSIKSSDPLVIEVPGFGSLEIGDIVEGAGGYTTVALHSGEPEVPEACTATGIVNIRYE